VAATATEARVALGPVPVSTLAAWESGGAEAPAPGAVPDVPSGWRHPRETHQGPLTRKHMRGRVQMASGSRRAVDAARQDAQRALDVLRRWGIRTLAQLADLPADDLSARLGTLGPRWQHAARGDDLAPLVPLVDDAPFDASLELEWPVEGLEPLSFVLGRVLEPLAVRLERADRGAAVLTTELHLTTRALHTRTLQLPAPMRDPKTLRTLILLDLESHPPAAAVDRVVVRVEPTPGRIVQWSLIERAQPSPEQVSTLLARLSALMGESHVGSPALVDSWRPGAFAMKAFAIRDQGPGTRDQRHRTDTSQIHTNDEHLDSAQVTEDRAFGSVTSSSPGPGPLVPGPCSVAFRRFRLPVPARVTMKDGRPVRLMPDRRGISGGEILNSAGPWRTSGHWWDQPAGEAPAAASRHAAWDRDEWDVVLADGVACRVFLERDVGQWFVEGCFD
jgi:protein ImuB